MKFLDQLGVIMLISGLTMEGEWYLSLGVLFIAFLLFNAEEEIKKEKETRGNKK